MCECTYIFCSQVQCERCMYGKYVCMRDEKEGRKKQARSNKQTRQSNTAHPRQSLFLRKMSYVYTSVGLEPTALYTTCIAITILQIITV